MKLLHLCLQIDVFTPLFESTLAAAYTIENENQVIHFNALQKYDLVVSLQVVLSHFESVQPRLVADPPVAILPNV